ncbi:hypothetical protein [Aliiroseovarius subalbicans]|uniref:hypothetical protein n=1 Tax=Aliiroseovarius subalbicans TaxID=2925840 RepID=UPI001F565B25|nr:hypothetical protein [Aliiroseovarius subalbicans]MCI2400862.1 hypothetical protein [Aliiroseovarius subalbicans]
MSMKDISAKLEEYQKRLKQGKAKKVEPKHVQKIIDKLTRKEADLIDELAATTKPGKRERLEKKLETLHSSRETATWLMEKL